MNRRNFLQLTAGALFGAQTGKRPNVIFILADDLGWGDPACYGHPNIKTPSIDRLASQGTLFTQFYVNCAVCSPSRTAFMTGHYPARYRVHGHFASPQQNQERGMPNWLDPAAPMLPRILKQAGYGTAHFGKWHLGSGKGAPDPGAYGFDVHRTVNSNGPELGNQHDPFFRARSTELIVDETIKFMEQSRDKPFFVNVWSLLPHATLNPTEEQMKPYARFGPRGVPYKGALQIYYASVSALDQAIGRLLAKVDEMGLAGNTVVALSSDNGPEDIHIVNASHSGVGSAGPFRGRKRSLYEGGIRMPFIARWPGHFPVGRVDDKSVLTAVDFLPTVCDLTGARTPADLNPDGEVVSDILQGKARARTKPIMWEWRFRVHGDTLNRSPMLAIRDGDWKLLMNPDRSRMELYDIPSDPSELNNLADRKPEVVQKMAQQVLAWEKTLPKGPVDSAAGKNDYAWPRARN